MGNYTIQIWIFLFFIYSFLGWIWEVCYVSACQRKLTNRGFLYSPILPIYGFGAIVVLISTLPFTENLYLVYIFGALGATLLEVVTGYSMEVLFKTRYWDYSNQKFNYKGYICLSSTIAWGFFSIIMVRYINVPIENFVFSINSTLLEVLVLVLLVIFTVDVTKSVQNALDLKELLETMASNNEKVNTIITEVEHLSESFAENKEDLLEHINHIREEVKTYEQNFVSKLSEIKEHKDSTVNHSYIFDKIQKTVSRVELHLLDLEYKKREDIIEEYNKVKLKIENNKSEVAPIDLKRFKGAISQLKRNPNADSKKLKDELDKVKKL